MPNLLSVGDAIPDFTLKDAWGEEVALADLKGEPFLLYFYPKDATPGCTDEACQFRDLQDAFDEMNLLVVGVSPDGVESHRKFSENNELNFTLLSDPKLSLATACGAVKVSDGQASAVLRSTFLCDGEGVVQWVESPVKVDGHARRVIEAAEDLLA